MPEQNNGRKPFRRNSSGPDAGFRRGEGAGDGRRSGGDSGGAGDTGPSGGRGGFRRDDNRGDARRSSEPDARGAGRGRPGSGGSGFGGDRPRDAQRADRAGREERTGSAGQRDRGADRAGGRSGFRAEGARSNWEDNRSRGPRPQSRPDGDKREYGTRERGDFRSQGRSSFGDSDRGRDNRGAGRADSRGGADDRRFGGRPSAQSAHGADERRFGGRAGSDRPDRGADDRRFGGRGGSERGSEERRFGGRGASDRPDRGSDRPRRDRVGPVESSNSGPGFSRGGDGGAPRRRGGEGGGRGTDRRPPRPDEPDLPDEVQAGDLDTSIRRDLLSLDKGNAETVARHLAMAVQVLDDDPQLALAHARAARQRAGRIAVVRETAGVVAYHAGEWAEALSELRAARRMAGGSGLLAVMADCERGLGRPERAIEIGRSDEGRALTGDEAIELRIVVAGARMDLGQYDQAVVTLQTSDLDPSRTGAGPARLFYAYADALVAAGRTDEGQTWFFNAAAADLDGETDAEERAAELTGEA